MRLAVSDFLEDQIVLRSEGAPLRPVVSVVLPTYARLKSGLMPRAVESVLKQTLVDLELIIIDDGSTDGSNEYIEELRARDPRVVHIRHEKNSGLPGLRCNEAIEIARGRYVAFQFDDDFWYPHALETLMRVAESRSEIAVTVGTMRWWDNSTGRRITGGYFPSRSVDFDTLFTTNQIANCSVLIPRLLFERYGMYDPHLALRRICDWDLWIRLIEHVPFRVTSELIGEVDTGNPDAIGMTVSVDASTVRFFSQIPRSDLLTPSAWRSYPVDGMTINGVALPEWMAQRVYDVHFVPYYSRFRHHYPQIEGFQKNALGPRCAGVLVTSWRSASNYLVFEAYDLLASRRGSVKAYQESIRTVDPHDLISADVVNFLRVTDPIMKSIVKQLPPEVPTAYTMDDNFMLLHEVDDNPQYQPEHPQFEALCQHLSQMDAVWCTTMPIRESVHSRNPRTVPINGAIKTDWLPRLPLKPSNDGRLRICYAGGSHRKREFELVWTALQKIAHDFPDKLEFEFWGLDVSTFPDLGVPVKVRDFTLSYLEYVEQLRNAQFHIMLVPLLESSPFYRGKSNPKYQECAIAGAVGIFSNAFPYRHIPDDFSCLKADNTAVDWETALRRVIEMSSDERDRLRENCVRHVRELCTAETQIGSYEAAWRATEFHAVTREYRDNRGRPRIVFAINHVPYDFHELTSLIELASDYSLEPFVLFTGQTRSAYTQPFEAFLAARSIPFQWLADVSPAGQVSTLSTHDRMKPVIMFLEEVKPALVHDLAYDRYLSRACGQRSIAYVHSLVSTTTSSLEHSDKSSISRSGLSYTSSLTLRSRFETATKLRAVYLQTPVSLSLFETGLRRSVLRQWPSPARVLIAGHKSDHLPELERALELLQAMGVDCHFVLFGDAAQRADVPPIGVTAGRETFSGLIQSVDQTGDAALQSADLLLFLGASDEFPHIVREAMAASVFVVTTTSAVVQEHIQSCTTGIILNDVQAKSVAEAIRLVHRLSSNERAAILDRARLVAIDEFHPHQAAINLLTLYYSSFLQTHPAIEGSTTSGKGNRSPATGAFVEESFEPPRASVRIHGRVRYVLHPDWNYWSGMDIMIGTHQRPATGTLHLAIRDTGGTVVRRASLSLDSCGDNQWARLSFEPLPYSAGQDFQCEFTLEGTNLQTKISFYETNRTNAPPLYRKLVWRSGIPLERSGLAVRLHYSQ